MLEKSIRIGINLPVHIIMTICYVNFQVNWVYTMQQLLMSLFAKSQSIITSYECPSIPSTEVNSLLVSGSSYFLRISFYTSAPISLLF